jgi:hypothetical protein
MSTQAPTKDARDANLDALKKAVDEWAKTETARLENEVKFLRSVLLGRGASEAGTKNLEEVSKLLQAEIDEFIVGG